MAILAVPTQCRVMPCGHVYCVPCIATRCRLGVRDRSLVPAHCCQKEFPSDYVKETLTPTDWATYERFVDERHWMRAGHHGFELVSDVDYADAVARQGWRQCPQCGVGVEKVDGCNAIKCLRGHHFCWGCGTAPCQCAPGMTTNLRLYGYRG